MVLGELPRRGVVGASLCTAGSSTGHGWYRWMSGSARCRRIARRTRSTGHRGRSRGPAGLNPRRARGRVDCTVEWRAGGPSVSDTAHGSNEAARAVAALGALLSDTIGVDERRRVYAAAQNGDSCGVCGRLLTSQETVWRIRLPAGTSPGSGRSAYLIASVCAGCLPGGNASRWARIPPRRCEGCGRGVIDCCRSGWRRITACCERCRRWAQSRRRVTPRREIACALCGETFWPSRADAQYHSAACRQKAYRARKRLP
jgi:hypothetical protein